MIYNKEGEQMNSEEALRELKANALVICDWELERLKIIEKDLEKLEKIKELIKLETWYAKEYSKYNRESIIRNFGKIAEILNIDL